MSQPIGKKDPNSKENGAFTPSFQKSFENSKASGVKRVRNFQFNIILKREIKSNDYLAEYLLAYTYPTIPVLAHSNVKSLSL
jgi:hypothetical protein